MRLTGAKLIKRLRRGTGLEFKLTIAEESTRANGRMIREMDRGTKFTKMATLIKEHS